MATAALPRENAKQLDRQGILARAGVALLIVLFVLTVPMWTSSAWDGRIALMGIYAIIGLSFNVITGYAGQISLGHQAFVGIGAFTAAYVVGHISNQFLIGFTAAGVLGAFLAFALGLVSLRVKGLYFALVTLAFGLMAQTTIFEWPAFTGAGGGAPAPRPSLFQSDQAFAYLCMIFVAVFLFVDWRLSKTKPGRAIVAVRNNETGASSLGVNVASYKLLAFAVGGFLAGVGGALYASFTGQAYAASYTFPDPALVWLLMAVVGGLGSRAGVVLGSAFFAILSPSAQLLPSKPLNVPGWLHFLGVRTVTLNTTISPLVGALLLILTVTLYPGGIGQQLLPIRRWMSGGPFRTPRRASYDDEDVSPFEVAAAVQAQAVAGTPEPTAAAVPAAVHETPPLDPEPEPEPEPMPEPEPIAEPEPEPAAVVEPPEPEREAATEELSVVTTPDDALEPEEQAEEEPAPRRSSLFGFRRRKERTP